MRTPRDLDQSLADILLLVGALLGRPRAPAPEDADPELRQRLDHDVEVAVEALRRMVARLTPTGGLSMEERPRAHSLTTRERMMVELLCGGKSYKDIANALDLSVLSVQSRVKQIYMKLAVHSKAELRSALIREDRAAAPLEASMQASATARFEDP